MSIYANNYTVDEVTGEVGLIKHLNQFRIDRGGCNYSPGGWNKSGKKARIRKTKAYMNWSKSMRRIFINKKLQE